MRQKISPEKTAKSKVPGSDIPELAKKLELFMLNTEESFVLVDLEFRIVTFNNQFNLLYSKYYGKKILKGHSILEYGQQTLVEELHRIYQRVFAGKVVEKELNVNLQGQSLTYLLKYKPAYDENHSIIGAFVSSKDITEIKRMRNSLLESEDKYRSIVEHSLIAFFLTTYDDNGHILEVNKAAVDMFGYSFKEFEKLKRHMLFDHSDPQVFKHKHNKKDSRNKGELIGIRKNGERFPCEFSSVYYTDIAGNKRITMTISDISDRKQAENKLRQNEEYLQVIIDNEPECVCIVDKTGKFTEMNPAGLRMFQANSIGDIFGKKLSDMVETADRRIYQSLFRSVMNGGHGTAAFRIIGLKQQQLWLEANAVPLKDHNCKTYAVLNVIRDVTERIEAEAKIRESESTLRAIFDNSTEGLMLLDMEGRIRAFNSRAAENHALHNIPLDLKIGHKLLDYIEKKRKPYFKSLLTKVFQGESVAYDIDYDRIDGDKSWFHATLSPVWKEGAVYGVCVTRSDISDRKHSEQKISEAVERYNMVAKATNDSIYDWDLQTNKVFRSGDGMKILFGYDHTAKNSNSDFWTSKIHPEDLPLCQKKLRDTLKNPKIDTCTNEYRFMRADGTYAYVFDKGFIMRNERGKAIRMIGATQDLSDMKFSEQQLKDLLSITNDQNKRLQNFAHIVSHNIRSHSANIIGLVDLLSEQETVKLGKNNLFTMLKTSTTKLSETIENLNDIITLQNQVRSEKKKLNLRSEVEKTCDAINILISQSGTRIANHIPEDIEVSVIPSYLESILLNLLTNAIKYSSPERKPVIRIQWRKIKDYYMMTIRDNGIGIDMDKNGDKLFGMYKTFHNNKDARGFGLFITKNQIEAMNGKIEVESTVGKGTIFKLYIYEKN